MNPSKQSEDSTLDCRWHSTRFGKHLKTTVVNCKFRHDRDNSGYVVKEFRQYLEGELDTDTYLKIE